MLEFPAVLDRLARLTAFSAGRERALALRPVTDRAIVVRRQRETAEAVRLDALGIEVPLGGAHDVRDRARAAARGMGLTVAELLEIAGTARATERVRRTLGRVEAEAPLLAAIGGGIADLAPVRTLIERSIDERGEVADSASPELASIRRQALAAHDRLQQRVQLLLRATEIRAALQEPLVTLREGRYVLPVRSEARGAIPGVIHDTSASGATVYVEPLVIIDLGNRWRELQLQERHEVERILRVISDAVGARADEIIDAVERLAAIDCTLAKARLAAAMGARDLARTGPDQPWIVEAPAALRLVEARHPLLQGVVVPTSLAVGGPPRAASADSAETDLISGDGVQALLITGPNTGGKTVALKTAGLLCLMALAGLPIPAAQGSQIPVYDSIFADIGDEQSIAQSLSTFSGHITAIIDIIERATPRSLVLLDELGAGTDPTEGAALAIALVERLRTAGVTLIATTHHSELKLYAHRTEGVMNASVEFNLDTLSPTYRLTLGLPGQSNALAIASRLGMPDEVIAVARAGLSSEQRDLESVLADLRAQLTAADERAARAQEARDEAELMRADLEEQLGILAAETSGIREDAHRQVRAEVRDTERLVQRTRREVESARLEQAVADLARAQHAAAALAPPPPEPEAPPARPRYTPRGGPILPGHSVWLRGIASAGEALSAPDPETGELDVQLGSLRTRVRVTQVERSAAEGAPRPPAPRVPPAPAPVADEIEVRGQTLDEALPKVESFLDHAARNGKHRVFLIHGKGTGAMRRAVREILDRHPLVVSYETAARQEGGEGVTVAYLAGTS